MPDRAQGVDGPDSAQIEAVIAFPKSFQPPHDCLLQVGRHRRLVGQGVSGETQMRREVPLIRLVESFVAGSEDFLGEVDAVYLLILFETGEEEHNHLLPEVICETVFNLIPEGFRLIPPMTEVDVPRREVLLESGVQELELLSPACFLSHQQPGAALCQLYESLRFSTRLALSYANIVVFY